MLRFIDSRSRFNRTTLHANGIDVMGWSPFNLEYVCRQRCQGQGQAFQYIQLGRMNRIISLKKDNLRVALVYNGGHTRCWKPGGIYSFLKMLCFDKTSSIWNKYRIYRLILKCVSILTCFKYAMYQVFFWPSQEEVYHRMFIT